MDEKKPPGRRGKLRTWLGLWASDILLAAGGALIGCGVSMIYPPAGVIAAGVLLIVWAVIWARGGVGP